MDQIRLGSSVKDLKSFNLWQSVIAEFIGTFLLAFIGFGSVFSNMNPVKVGLGFGLAGVVIIYCIGPISGGHINPSVSFGLLIARQISLVRFIFYFISQVLGATIGFKLISKLTDGKVLSMSQLSLNTTSIDINLNSLKNFDCTCNNRNLNISQLGYLPITEKIDKIDSLQLKIFCELVISFVLVFTVMRLCVEKSRSATEKGLAPLIIGLSIAVGVYCGMNISGGSMNPAVSLGKYFCTRASKGLSSHIVGPLTGGFLAAILQQLLFTSSFSVDHVKSYLFSRDFDKDDSQTVEDSKDIQLNEIEKNNKTTKGNYSPKIEHQTCSN